MSDRVLCPDAFAADLAHEPVPTDDVIAGSPTAAAESWGEIGGAEVGVWEITAGTVRDTEVEEVFVVLSGEGTVTFDDGAAIALGPGIVVRLRAGERTRWEIRQTLRKVYVAG